MKRLGMLLLVWLWLPASLAETPRLPAAAVASAHPLATAAGHEILKQGGNAFDAAVAVAAALAVVEPHGSGLGGGGFWLLHREGQGCPNPLRGGGHRTAAARSDPQGRGEVEQRREQLPGCAGAAEASFDVMVDGRERAPRVATEKMYLDAAGNPVPRKSLDGALAAAIPGTPAAIVHVAQKYGRLPLAQSLAPAVRLAREGFAVTPAYRKWIAHRVSALSASPAAARVYLSGNEIPPLGHVVRQPELAGVLARLGQDGGKDFYRGATARFLVAGVRAAAGIWTAEDLAQYRVVERAPVRVTYRGIRVTAAALPSSGGVVLGQMFGILAGFELDRLDRAARTETLVGAMRLAYRDRARYLGDPDFVTVDTARLLDPAYIEALRNELRSGKKQEAAPAREAAAPGILDRNSGNCSRRCSTSRIPAVARRGSTSSVPGVVPSRDVQGGTSVARDRMSGATGTTPSLEGAQVNTTHFSIIDRDGNRAAVTLSLNGPFGSGFVPPGTGVLLNNEMDDFVLKPGVANLYGLTGSAANAIAPGKRPLSSMTPAFLETDDAVVVLGTPGGSRIITMVLLAALDVAAGRGGPKNWVVRPRFHHQYPSAHVDYEPRALTAEELLALAAGGYTPVERAEGYGNMQLVAWFKKAGRVEAASDPRGEGAAVVK